MRGMDQTMFPDAHQMSCELLCMLLEYGTDPNAVQEQAVYFTSESKSIADKRSVLQVIHQSLAVSDLSCEVAPLPSTMSLRS